MSHTPPLLDLIDAFLAETGMGPTYFGKLAANNSDFVKRLRDGRPILTSTETRVREFIANRRQNTSPADPRLDAGAA